MTHKRTLLCAAAAVVATALPLQNALAACANAFASGAVWHFHVIQAGANGAAAVRCVGTFGAGGNFTGPCTNFESGQSGSRAVNVSGKLTLKAAWDFTGSVTIPGDAKVLVKFGHINGGAGSAIGTQYTGASLEVLQINLIRK